MDAASAFFDGRSSNWSYDSLKNLNRLSAPVQTHLRKVYTTLCVALSVSALGVLAHIAWHFGGLLSIAGFLGSTIWLVSTPASQQNEDKRWRLLMAAAFFEGGSLGGLIETVIDFDPSILVTATLGSVAIFACFSGAAIYARRREYLFLGGILSSAISTMMMLRLGSYLFGGSSIVFNLELYVGLLVFVGYVVFDTQVIIEKSDKGDRDYIQHSLDLFMDFVSIFVRILVIMLKNSNARKEETRKKRQSR